MRSSAGRPADMAYEDLTARARIRDAALLQFAERGVKGATIRSIAEAGDAPGRGSGPRPGWSAAHLQRRGPQGGLRPAGAAMADDAPPRAQPMTRGPASHGPRAPPIHS
jgi:hypothetical protein